MAKKKNNKVKATAANKPANKTVERSDPEQDIAEQSNDTNDSNVVNNNVNTDATKPGDDIQEQPTIEDPNEKNKRESSEELEMEKNEVPSRPETKVDEADSTSAPDVTKSVEPSPSPSSSPAPQEPVPQQEESVVKPESSSEPTPELKAPAVKKRLTLQERLALAAKSKKSKRSTSGANVDDKKSKAVSPEPSTRETSVEPPTNTTPVTSEEALKIPSPTSTPSVSQPESTVPTRESSLDFKRTDPTRLFPKDFKSLPLEELHKLITEAENKYTGIESKNETLKIEKQSLQEKIKNLSSSVTPSSASLASTQLLKDKDEKIAQLLKEGEALSMKELKYTNTIKKLKSIESDNEREIRRLVEKVESLESEKKQFKDENKLLKDSEHQVNMKTKTLQKQLDNEKEELQEEINRNRELSKKVEELSQVLIQEKNQASNKINELKRSLDKEKQKAEIAHEESIAEINRLESKIEQLRYQNENSQAHSTTNDEGYLKLIRQHDTLQDQYTSATENWQSIEASLMSKLSNYESELSEIQTKLEASEQKNEILTNDLRSKTDEIQDLNKKLKNLSLELSTSQTKLDQATKDFEELQGKYESKDIGFSKEKAALEYKIQGLERQFKETIQPQHLSVQTPNYGNNEFSPQIPHNVSTPSFKRGGSWEIGLGESSTTPRQSRKSSGLFFPSYNSSMNDSLNEQAEISSDFDDNETVGSPVSQFNNGSRFENNSSSAIGGTSVQLLGKMSSQVRRLETELSTMKEELEKLSNEKKAANEEIVRLMKDNEHVEFYKSKISELEAQVDGYTKRHEKTLEVLGEKSEQVEELKADVQDLKDLCRQQVQQLVDLQTK